MKKCPSLFENKRQRQTIHIRWAQVINCMVSLLCALKFHPEYVEIKFNLFNEASFNILIRVSFRNHDKCLNMGQANDVGIKTGQYSLTEDSIWSFF